MEFDNKVVIITGASSGIGAACALNFAKSSAKLVLVGRNLNKLSKVSNECQKLSRLKNVIVIADITKEDDVDRIVKETLNNFGRIDVLINNAAVWVMSQLENQIDAFDRVMKTNVRGTMLITEKAISHLIVTKGNIVNISSILSTMPVRSTAAYCMSKAALDMYTKCAALELGPKGIRVNSVNPGMVHTDLFRNANMKEEETAKVFDLMKKYSPLNVLTQSEDVADIVKFLASDRARCITGNICPIECGTSIELIPME